MTDPHLDDLNPYAPPEAPLERPVPAPFVAPPPSVEEAIRIDCVRDERLIRALGPANFAAVYAVARRLAFNVYQTREFVVSGVWEQIPYASKVSWIAQIFVVSSLLIILHIALGRALWRLEPWARSWQIGFSGVVLVSFVIQWMSMLFGLSGEGANTSQAFGIAHIVIIYILIGARSARVFSEKYREAIEATPWIGNGPGPALWIGAILGGIFASRGDDCLAYVIGQHFAPRLMGAHDVP